VIGIDLARDGADHAHRHGVGEPRRAPDGEHDRTLAQAGSLPERECGQTRGVDLQQGEVRRLIETDYAGAQHGSRERSRAFPVSGLGEDHPYALRAADHVGVGDNEPA